MLDGGVQCCAVHPQVPPSAVGSGGLAGMEAVVHVVGGDTGAVGLHRCPAPLIVALVQGRYVAQGTDDEGAVQQQAGPLPPHCEPGRTKVRRRGQG
jgi:hypothetical protein